MDNLIHNLNKIKINGNKIAAFDFDYTLVKPKSKKKFPEDSDDWVILYPNILTQLKNDRPLEKTNRRKN